MLYSLLETKIIWCELQCLFMFVCISDDGSDMIRIYKIHQNTVNGYKKVNDDSLKSNDKFVLGVCRGNWNWAGFMLDITMVIR